jgi:hypothetical protein
LDSVMSEEAWCECVKMLCLIVNVQKGGCRVVVMYYIKPGVPKYARPP